MRKVLKALLSITIIIVVGAGVFLYNLQYRTPFTIKEFVELTAQKYTEENPHEYIQALRDCMLEGKPEVSVNYVGSLDKMNTFAEEVLEHVFDYDDPSTSSDYDYLRYNYAGMKISMDGIYGYYKLNYQFSYMETKEQTDEVDKEIDRLFNEWKIGELSDYKKVKKIHDYIILNSSYDMSAKKNTAYSCLIEKQSACQGYAALVYKMLTKADVPCRIIVGRGNNENHAWNIVKLNDFWYNLDCTWDDPIGPVGDDYISYEFFLKGTLNFKNHTPDEKYTTESFEMEYSISPGDYKVKRKK